MALRQRMSHVPFAVCVVLVLIATAMVQLLGTVSDASDISVYAAGQSLGHAGLGASAKIHKLTGQEVQQLKTTVGIREPGRDYNTMIDGHGTGLAPPSEDAWDQFIGQVNVVDVQSVEPSILGSSMDLSSSLYFPPVGDQSFQGSCSAWAATYYSYGYMEAVDHGWTEAHDGSIYQLLSPAWTYNKVNDGWDNGSWTWDNFYIIRDWGAATLSTMPYVPADSRSWGGADASREAPSHRGLEVFLLNYTGPETVDAVKMLVSSGIPMTFSINTDMYVGLDDGNYVISTADVDYFDSDHAQTIVGYDDSIGQDSELGSFKIVNSWGSSFADNGYYWLTYDAFKVLGARKYLNLTYMSDRQNYEPSLLAIWHFNDAPIKNGTIEVGAGTAASPVQVKTPFYLGDFIDRHIFPTWMCLDVSELMSSYVNGTTDFFFRFSPLPSLPPGGTISSFRIEMYERGYVPGAASQISVQSVSVPAASGSAVVTTLLYYSPIPTDIALDTVGTNFGSTTSVNWVGVNHHSLDLSSSMESGDVGDGQSTDLSMTVSGPGEISFSWKVSSESSCDYLSFDVNGSELARIDGDVDWTAKRFAIGAGANLVMWKYAKDASVSARDDCGWVDRVSFRILEPPTASLDVTPLGGDTTTLFTFDASASFDGQDNSSALEVRWDWEADWIWDTGWSTDKIATHQYVQMGNYTVRIEVRDTDNLTSMSEKEVEVVEVIPEFDAPVFPALALMIVVLLVTRAVSGRSGRARL